LRRGPCSELVYPGAVAQALDLGGTLDLRQECGDRILARHLKAGRAKQSIPVLVVDRCPWPDLAREDLQRHFTKTATLQSPVEVFKAKLRIDAERAAEFAQEVFIAVCLLIEMVSQGPKPSGALALRDDLLRDAAALSGEQVVDGRYRVGVRHARDPTTGRG
jgi:hypothetical protein